MKQGDDSKSVCGAFFQQPRWISLLNHFGWRFGQTLPDS